MRPIVVTPGCQLGIGAEVTATALSRVDVGEVWVVGDPSAIARSGIRERPGVRVVDPPRSGEPVEIAAIRWATAACLTGEARALCTGPIHKGRAAAGGFAFSGHTDFLAHLCGTGEPVMAFVGGDVRVALVTVHVPLRAVPALITQAAVLHTLRVVHTSLSRELGMAAPRLAVCGLNPHAGEGGLLGSEEQEAIAPAVRQALAEGIAAHGPVSAEEAFMHPENADLIVAMYHDQGLAPLKRVDFGRSVNWTMGLPIIRTSVDHGTADALVGTGRARADSMEAALRLADRLSHRSGR